MINDALGKEAERLSMELNKMMSDRIMLAQTVQGFTPDQASLICVIAHAFSLQRLLHFPGLAADKREAFAQLAKNIMSGDKAGVAPIVRQ